MQKFYVFMEYNIIKLLGKGNWVFPVSLNQICWWNMQSTRRSPASLKTQTPKLRLVKCVLCGKLLSSQEAFVVKNGPKTSYYCSREEYEGGEEYVKKRLVQEGYVAEYVKRITGVDELIHATYDPALLEWLKYAALKDLVSFLAEKSDIITALIAKKGITSPDVKLKYLGAVIKNSIAKFVENQPKEVPPQNIDFDIEMYKPKLTPRRGLRRSMEDLEDEYGTKN